ncbi:MAG: sugar kinase [Nitrososphaerales archaeon]
MTGRLDVVTLGEAMVRLSPPHHQRLEQATSLDVVIGGAELSVAVGVARLGLRSSWVTKLPRNPLGRRIVNQAREQGVDVSRVVWTDEGRAGLYFLESGAAPRPSSVLYDRKGSAASTMAPGEVDWRFLKGVRVLHTTGITPALSESCRETTVEAIRAAKRAGCRVCFDVNYRSKLWSPKEAEAALTPIVKMADVLIASDAAVIWGVEGEPEDVLRELKKRFGVPVVAMTVREDVGVLRTRSTSLAIAEKRYSGSKSYDIEVVDRLGSGDSFAAGLIYGYLLGDLQKALDYGDAMAAYKATVPGDVNYATKEEIDRLVASGENLRIQR